MAKMRKVKLASGLEIEVGSGNVYKDLGFKRPVVSHSNAPRLRFRRSA